MNDSTPLSPLNDPTSLSPLAEEKGLRPTLPPFAVVLWCIQDKTYVCNTGNPIKLAKKMMVPRFWHPTQNTNSINRTLQLVTLTFRLLQIYS